MEIKIALIRSGMTQSGKQGRYIGAADESLCKDGINLLEAKKQEGCYAEAGRLYASGAKRCIETAKFLYEGQFIFLADGLSAYDYGDLEGKTYDEIQKDPQFEAWACGKSDRLPGADNPYPARRAAVAAFERIMSECSENEIGSAAIVTHRPVILAILRERCTPKYAYNNIDIEYGGGALLIYNDYTKSLCVKDLF